MGYSPSQKSTDSQFSSTKHKNAHVLVKNPFPDKQPLNTGKSVNKKAVSLDEDENDDILD